MQKGHSETLIVELGGPNYAKVGAKMMDFEGNKVDVHGATSKGFGYRYFWAMKILPDVKEIFNKPPKVKKRRCRYDIYKQIDATSYYGYRNYEDGILEKFEQPEEEKMQARALREWQMIEFVH
jgi:pre-mRNA-splicing factor ISY1